MAQTELDQRLSDDKLQEIVAEGRRKKGLVTEYQGHLGQHIKTNAERYEFPASLITQAMKMAQMDDGKRQSLMLGTVQMWRKMKFTHPDQWDLYSDFRTEIIQLAAEFSGQTEQKSDEGNGADRLRGLKALSNLSDAAAA
jgi:hypothetical protein